VVLYVAKIESKSELINTTRKSIFYKGYCSDIAMYYWIMIIYIWIAYGGQCVYLLLFVTTRTMTNISVIILLIAMIWITISFPKFFYYMALYSNLDGIL